MMLQHHNGEVGGACQLWNNGRNYEITQLAHGLFGMDHQASFLLQIMEDVFSFLQQP
jgi:hypothetical protein